VLRTVQRSSGSLLGSGNNLSDRARAQPTGAKSELLEKSVVELVPMTSSDEFLDRPVRDWGVGGSEEFGEISLRCREEVTGGDRGVEGCEDGVIHDKKRVRVVLESAGMGRTLLVRKAQIMMLERKEEMTTENFRKGSPEHF